MRRLCLLAFPPSGDHPLGAVLAQRVLQIALFTTMLTYEADSIGGHRTQGLALFGLSGLFPVALGGIAGDLVIDAFGYPALFVLASAAASPHGSWLAPAATAHPWSPSSTWLLGRFRPAKSPSPVVGDLMFSIGMETVFTFTRTYVGDRGIGSTGLFFGVYGVSAAAMRIAGGRRYDRVPQRPFVAGSLLAYGSGLVLMAIAANTAVIVMAAVAAGMAHGALFPILTSQVVSRARTAERGSAMSIYTSIFDIALLVSAPAVGLAIDGFDYRTAFSAVAVMLGIGAVVYSLWDRWLVSSEAAVGAESASIGEEIAEEAEDSPARTRRSGRSGG